MGGKSVVQYGDQCANCKTYYNLANCDFGSRYSQFCLQIFTGTDPAEMLVRKTTLFATEEQIQAMRVELGLDGTLSEQYADYIKGLLTGDLGISITNRKPVIDNIRNALPVTCMLVIMSMLWVAILTVLISAFSVIWKDKAFDHATRVICIIGICVPSFGWHSFC